MEETLDRATLRLGTLWLAEHWAKYIGPFSRCVTVAQCWPTPRQRIPPTERTQSHGARLVVFVDAEFIASVGKMPVFDFIQSG